MVAAFRASAVAGNGQAAVVSSLSITIPGTAAVGDNASLTVTSSSSTVSLTTPAGWSLQSGPDRVGSVTGWLLTRTIASGNPGSTVTLMFSATSRCEAVMEVSSGTTTTGLQVSKVVESSSTGAPTLPSLASVASGAYVSVSLARRFGGTPAPTFTLPTGWTAGPTAKTAYGSSPELSAAAGHQVTSASGAVGGGNASGTSASIGANYLVAWPASSSGTAVSVAGATGAGSGSADMGTVVVTTAAPPVWPPDPYRAAIRTGITISYTADASLSGIPVTGATGLQLVSGTVTDTTAPGVRRQLSCVLPPTPGLFDLLNVPGIRLKVTAHTSVNSVPIAAIPMGVFVVTQPKLATGGGGLTISAPDKWALIQRAKFIGLATSWVGAPVTAQIAQMIRDAISPSEPVNITATSTAVMGSQTWTGDRGQAINDLAAGIGAWVFFDRDGVATVEDLPTIGAESDWLIDATPSGVLIELDRAGSLDGFSNVVVISSSGASGNAFNPQTVWDSDPASPTYAGTDPWHGVGTGPAGISVYDMTTALPLDDVGALAAAGAQLAKLVGIASQDSGTSAPNPAMDAFDVVDVLRPREHYDIPRIMARRVVDTVTHQLDVTQPMTWTFRSTRISSYS